MELSKSEKELFADFPKQLRDAIGLGSKNLQVKKYESTGKASDDEFILFYAFYKDDAFARRQKIPTYREIYADFQKIRKHSSLLFAYFETIPVAALWVSKEDGQLVIHASGSVKHGYDHHADVLLFWEGVKFAKTLQLQSVKFEADSLFHGIIGL